MQTGNCHFYINIIQYLVQLKLQELQFFKKNQSMGRHSSFQVDPRVNQKEPTKIAILETPESILSKAYLLINLPFSHPKNLSSQQLILTAIYCVCEISPTSIPRIFQFTSHITKARERTTTSHVCLSLPQNEMSYKQLNEVRNLFLSFLLTNCVQKLIYRHKHFKNCQQ